MGKAKPPAQPWVAYVPPKLTLGICQGCGATILTLVAGTTEMAFVDEATGKSKLRNVLTYLPQEQPLNPVTGTLHNCTEAREWQERVEQLRTDPQAHVQYMQEREQVLREARDRENPWVKKEAYDDKSTLLATGRAEALCPVQYASHGEQAHVYTVPRQSHCEAKNREREAVSTGLVQRVWGNQ